MLAATIIAFSSTVAAFGGKRPVVRRVNGREATSACPPVAELCAEAICAATKRTEKAILTAALQRDLRIRVGSRSNVALFIAEDADANIVGSCAIEVSKLSPSALDERRLGRQGALEAELADRPLLSSLAISPSFRRRGLAQECVLLALEPAQLALACRRPFSPSPLTMPSAPSVREPQAVPRG
jgi:hypothetical protein